MTRTLYLLYSTLICCAAMLLNACVDDGLGFKNGPTDGVADITLDLSFSPFAEGNLTRADISDGNGRMLNTINDLCILVYDSKGNLIEDKDNTYPRKVDLVQHPVKDEKRTDQDASNGKTAESSTKSVKGISLRLPFGQYFIVGVANLTGGTLERLKESDEHKTLSGLRRMKMSWNNSNLADNCEMMGYFSDTEVTASNSVPAADRAFASVAVNRAGMKLHSWLRRCASKITIDFDGSNLRENVTVYIKEARIYDIPYDCTLGFGQPVTTDESEKAYNHRVSKDDKTPDGFFHESPQVISYAVNTDGASAGEYWKNWPAITKGTPVIKDNNSLEDYPTAKPIDFHAETANALYFYENMQDNPEGKTKIPVPDLSAGGVAGKDEKKDGIKYGTYIEVTGYYHSNADGNPAHGEIKYRFMLGKNVTDNFEAERNYHYKLTLCPRGNGNDADWHIEFNEPKGFHVPNPWYVSYLYNHDASLPFKYIPEDGWEIVGLEGEIVTNPWYPTDCPFDELIDTGRPITPTTPSGDEADPYSNTANQGNYNGFLSLRAPDNVVITSNMASGKGWPGYNKGGNTINEAYYNGTAPSTSKINRGHRIYLKDGKEYEYNDYASGSDVDALMERDKFTWKKDGDAMSFSIPLFTRSKVLVKETGYSGNNPFVGYQRIARVKLTVTLKNKKDGTTKTDSDLVNAVQVRRVVNPKGVYRKSRNHEPFHVTMMWLDGDDSDVFSPVTSHGPWKAEIIGDNNFITLDGRQTVSGSTDTPVDFTIRFNRMNNDDKVRNAVVRIKYHNYTCTHLIFVRQGYDPQELMPSADCMDFTTRKGDTGEFNGGATPVAWRTFNMISENLEATDPRDEGSLFKFRNSAQAIDAVNNIYKDDAGNELYHNLSQNEFKNNTGPFLLVDDNGNLSTTRTGWTEMTTGSAFKGKMAKTATMRHFEQLYLSRNVNFGYGVLYADGATETQKQVSMAYGYYRRDSYPGGGSPKGMRGMFAYYWDGKSVGGSSYNGRNIFFPIGRAGYGHRKDKKEGATGTEPGNGILRYSCNRGAPRVDIFTNDAPLFVSIYRRPGAIYWAKDKIKYHEFLMYDRKLLTDASGDAFGLDINYFSFDVNAILTTNVGFKANEDETGKVGDACFVRCVD